MAGKQDILIVVDCKNLTVRMYAEDPHVAINGSQGSEELYIKVPENTRLSWHAVPQQFSEGLDGEGRYAVIISKVRLWSNANKYLTNWGTIDNRAADPVYTSQNSISFHTAGANHESDELAITVDPNIPTYLPCVQCTTTLPLGDPGGEKVAYTFWVKIYREGKFLKEFSWDPFVKVIAGYSF